MDVPAYHAANNLPTLSKTIFWMTTFIRSRSVGPQLGKCRSCGFNSSPPFGPPAKDNHGLMGLRFAQSLCGGDSVDQRFPLKPEGAPHR